MNNVSWTSKSFDELTLHELYELLRLRAEVFVVEQDCAYLDMDRVDQNCQHVLGTENESLAAYARTYVDQEGFWIGRIITSPQFRGQGLGAILMAKSMALCPAGLPTLMHAQTHLTEFYGRYGFKRKGDPFLEDGIPHVVMIKDPAS